MSDEDIKKSITEKSGDNIGGFINLVEYKESFFTKVISKIKNFFARLVG